MLKLRPGSLFLASLGFLFVFLVVTIRLIWRIVSISWWIFRRVIFLVFARLFTGFLFRSIFVGAPRTLWTFPTFIAILWTGSRSVVILSIALFLVTILGRHTILFLFIFRWFRGFFSVFQRPAALLSVISTGWLDWWMRMTAPLITRVFFGRGGVSFIISTVPVIFWRSFFFLFPFLSTLFLFSFNILLSFHSGFTFHRIFHIFVFLVFGWIYFLLRKWGNKNFDFKFVLLTQYFGVLFIFLFRDWLDEKFAQCHFKSTDRQLNDNSSNIAIESLNLKKKNWLTTFSQSSTNLQETQISTNQ